jgi:hypothetical protein
LGELKGQCLTVKGQGQTLKSPDITTSYDVTPSSINVGRVQRKATIGIEYANFASSFKYLTGNRTIIKLLMFVKKDIHPTPGVVMVKIMVLTVVKHCHFENNGRSKKKFKNSDKID